MTDRGGPSKLDRHRKERYSGSHTFPRLLVDHKAAQCKEPRDKIYGLVGLAADARGFPMDYQKPLIDVWVDTMEFVNRRQLVSEADMIPFGKLVKNLLMGTQSTPLQQVSCPYQNKSDGVQVIEEDTWGPRNPKVFHQSAFLLGCVSHIGPSVAEIVGSLHKVDEWAQKLQEAFRSDLGNAHQESSRLLEAILELDQEKLETACPSHVSIVQWEANVSRLADSSILRTYESPLLGTGAYHQDVHSWGRRFYTRKEVNSQADQSIRLYQLHNPILRETMPWKMGVTSGQAQRGDLICWIEGIQKAILIRVHEGYVEYSMKMQIIGTALVTEDIRYMSGLGETQANRCEDLPNHVFPVKMDARILFVLLK